MLKPAILYKTQIEQKFAELMYTEDAFLYNGYSHSCVLPEIKPEEGYYQWAILDGETVVGYLTYFINGYSDSVERFGLISFDKGNLTVTLDTFTELKRLVKEQGLSYILRHFTALFPMIGKSWALRAETIH